MQTEINDQLETRRAEARAGGGERRIAAQHEKGKLTARERLDVLLDEGSFEEYGIYKTHRCVDFGMADNVIAGDGVVTGWGTISGRPVYVFSQDFTVFGGSLSETHAEKICQVMDLAVQNGVPLIGLNDSGGARIQEGVASLGGYAEVFWTVTNEIVTAEELGGASTHTRKSSVADNAFDDDIQTLMEVRRLYSFLPLSSQEVPPAYASTDSATRIDEALDTLVPASANQPYDMRELVHCIADAGDFLEIQPEHAGNILCGFVRMGGETVGIVANQPIVLAGVLDIDTGVRRHHQARGKAFVCLRRSNRPQDYRDHAQGLWRCV